MDNIYIIFGNKLYRQIDGFRWVQIVHPLKPISYFAMISLSDDNQADIIRTFNPTSRYLDELLILTIRMSKQWSNGFVSSKVYDKHNYFDIVNFPFLDGDVRSRPSYGVFISQLIRFARVCSHVHVLNASNTCLTSKLLTNTLSIPDTDETAETPVKRYCNTG